MCYYSHQEAFIRKWTTDIWDGQHEDGGLEAIAPSMMMKDIEQFVGDLQSNHGVHMLYTLWRMYGDIRTFRRYQNQAEKYFEFLERNADRHIRFATGCDWLGILEQTDHSDTLHGYGDGSPGMIGTAHYAVAALSLIHIWFTIPHRRLQPYLRPHCLWGKKPGLFYLPEPGSWLEWKRMSLRTWKHVISTICRIRDWPFTKTW